jgi:hypothetical protein
MGDQGMRCGLSSDPAIGIRAGRTLVVIRIEYRA